MGFNGGIGLIGEIWLDNGCTTAADGGDVTGAMGLTGFLELVLISFFGSEVISKQSKQLSNIGMVHRFLLRLARATIIAANNNQHYLGFDTSTAR